MGQLYRVAIVGSGPAGLSAAARAAERGLSHVLLEKADHLSDTIFKYQRGKHVMATPAQVPLRSDAPFQADSREAVLRGWDETALTLGLNVRYRAEVTAITGARGRFTLALAGGETVEAEAVVLAVGVAGNPNRLRIPGGDFDCVQYQLDDPRDHYGEAIVIVGGGDAGIENALGLAEADLGNRVTLLQRGPDFSRAKPANVALLQEAKSQGRLDYLTECTPKSLAGGVMTVETRTGETRLDCDLAIARLGATPPRRFVEACGVAFGSDDPRAFPTLSPTFETTTPGLYVIGALAGYPLIKQCLNQGYDVIERLAGNADLKPADEPILDAKLKPILGASVHDKLERLRGSIAIFGEVSPLQLREFMLDAEVQVLGRNDVVFRRNDAGSSLFAVASGSVVVEVDPRKPRQGVVIPAGQIFGEIGLISGRRRGATIRATDGAVLIEAPRMAALKLMAVAPGVKRRIDRIIVERMLKGLFGEIPLAPMTAILDAAELKTVAAGEVLIQEGEAGSDLFMIRAGSAVVEKQIGGRKVFLSYVPAGAYVGEMAVFDRGRRTATVRAAIKSEVIRIPGALFAELSAADPGVVARVRAQAADRRRMNDHVEAQKAEFSSVVDLYTATADFLVGEGLGEATDALLIDETLCIGCDNCEVACAESHDGLSRLDRETGRTYAHLHVPTSCRHCENPHCMTDCPPNAISRGPDGEISIDDSCIGCGNCQRNCPYGVIQMETAPPKKPGLLPWLTLGLGPGPGQPGPDWIRRHTARRKDPPHKVAVKCDMCKGIRGGPACVRACPTGAAMRVSPEGLLRVSRAEPAG